MKLRLLPYLVLIALPSYGQEIHAMRLADSALTLTLQNVQYDPSYFRIPYPNGDVPANKGVCTDVIIRAFRKIGIDLQKEVHQDMLANFKKYPAKWGLTKPDSNIDHRRVPNLMTYFQRHHIKLPTTSNATAYLPGDIVCWNLGGGITHIGIIVNRKSADGARFHVVHNIGNGQREEDFLFDFPIIGHYRLRQQTIFHNAN